MNLAKAKFLVVRRHWTQMGAKQEQERIIKLLHQELADGFAKAFVIGLIIGEQPPHARSDAKEQTNE
jgi:hypothetical protein